MSSDRLTERQPVLVNRLSEQQRHLLLKLAERQTTEDVEAVEAEAEAECFSLPGMMRHGVPIRRLPKGVSRSYSASVSRAMRRLEQRGLIVRFNWISNGYTDNQHPNGYQMRTTHISLTKQGLCVAEQLRGPTL